MAEVPFKVGDKVSFIDEDTNGSAKRPTLLRKHPENVFTVYAIDVQPNNCYIQLVEDAAYLKFWFYASRFRKATHFTMTSDDLENLLDE